MPCKEQELTGVTARIAARDFRRTAYTLRTSSHPIEARPSSEGDQALMWSHYLSFARLVSCHGFEVIQIESTRNLRRQMRSQGEHP